MSRHFFEQNGKVGHSCSGPASFFPQTGHVTVTLRHSDESFELLLLPVAADELPLLLAPSGELAAEVELSLLAVPAASLSFLAADL